MHSVQQRSRKSSPSSNRAHGCSRLARVLAIRRLISPNVVSTLLRSKFPIPITRKLVSFPIIDYDGHHIPFDDNSFDIVFSSNVLEHICDLHQINREIQRVLRSDGYCVHVIPTHTWRFWTTLSAFPTAFQYAGALKSQLLPRKIPKRDVVYGKLGLRLAYALIDVLREIWRLARRVVAGRPPPGGAILPTSTRRPWQRHFRTLAVSPNLVAARISRRWVRSSETSQWVYSIRET